MSGVSLTGGAPADGQGTPPNDNPGGNTPPAGGSAGSPPTGGTPPNDAWYSKVTDPSLRTLAENKGWKTEADALKSYSELEKAFGQKTAPRAPKDPTEYKFDAPSDLPKGMTYDNKFAEAFKAIAHKADLSPEAAKAIHDGYVEYAKGSFSAALSGSQASLTEKVNKAAEALETTFGAKAGTPAFNRQVELAKRSMRLLDPKLGDALREAGIIVSVEGQDMVGNPTIFAALAKVGNAMFAEDSLHGAPAADTNPFDDKTENLQQQGWLVRNDPEKAKMLIRAAGKEKMFAAFLSK